MSFPRKRGPGDAHPTCDWRQALQAVDRASRGDFELPTADAKRHRSNSQSSVVPAYGCKENHPKVSRPRGSAAGPAHTLKEGSASSLRAMLAKLSSPRGGAASEMSGFDGKPVTTVGEPFIPSKPNPPLRSKPQRAAGGRRAIRVPEPGDSGAGIHAREAIAPVSATGIPPVLPHARRSPARKHPAAAVGLPKAAEARPPPRSPVRSGGCETDRNHTYELTQSALVSIREREKLWLDNQRASDSMATNAMIAMRKRRAAAARLASAASLNDFESMLSTGIALWMREPEAIAEAAVTKLAIFTNEQLDNAFGGFRRLIAHLNDRGVQGSPFGRNLRGEEVSGMAIAEFLLPLGPRTDPDEDLMRAVGASTVRPGERDGSSVRLSCRNQLTFANKHLGGVLLVNINAPVVKAVDVSSSREPKGYHAASLGMIHCIERASLDAGRSAMERGFLGGLLMLAAGGTRGEHGRKIHITHSDKVMGMVRGICEVRKHKDKAKARPIEFMANTNLTLSGQEAGLWLEAWWDMVRDVPQMGCLVRDISRASPSLPGCRWANKPCPNWKLLNFFRRFLREDMGLSSDDSRGYNLTSLRKFQQNVARAVGLSRNEAHELGAWEGSIMASQRSVLGVKAPKVHANLYSGSMPDTCSRDSELGIVASIFRGIWADARRVLREQGGAMPAQHGWELFTRWEGR